MKKLNTNELILKIEKLAKQRMAGESVVSLDKFRALKNKTEPKTLLIIEDDESMQKALVRILEPEGYTLRVAKDASELTTLLDDNPIDLIILDIGLPWINGFEIAEMLKQHRDLKSIPLVFVSGQAKEADVKRAFEIGADDFLKKPFDIAKLKKTVKVLLKLTDQV